MRGTIFGQVSLWAVIGAAMYYSVAATPEVRPALQAASVTALLPEELWQSPALFTALRCVAVVALLLWAANILLPFSACTAAIGFFLLISNAVAGQIYVRHQPHVVAMLLCVYAVWVLSRYREISAAPRLWCYGRAAPYPQWVYSVALFYLTSTYSFAGVSKLLGSGLNWANGTALQLWCYLSEGRGVLLRDLCLYDRSLAAALQAVVLFAELTCILCFFLPRLRRVYGAILLGFHLSVEWLFGLGFYGNILAGLLFLLLYPRTFENNSTA